MPGWKFASGKPLGPGVAIRAQYRHMDDGRYLAVLVEAAVRNTILQLRGIDTYREFIERHRLMMERGDSGL